MIQHHNYLPLLGIQSWYLRDSSTNPIIIFPIFDGSKRRGILIMDAIDEEFAGSKTHKLMVSLFRALNLDFKSEKLVTEDLQQGKSVV